MNVSIKILADSLKYLSDYMDVNNQWDYLTKAIEKHCNRYKIEPDICAWYKDLEDFFSDWCAIGYTRGEALKILHGGIGEFQTFPNGNIIRYVI